MLKHLGSRTPGEGILPGLELFEALHASPDLSRGFFRELSSSPAIRAGLTGELLILHSPIETAQAAGGLLRAGSGGQEYCSFFTALGRAFRTPLAKAFVLCSGRRTLDANAYRTAETEALYFLGQDELYPPVYLRLVGRFRALLRQDPQISREFLDLLDRLEEKVLSVASWVRCNPGADEPELEVDVELARGVAEATLAEAFDGIRQGCVQELGGPANGLLQAPFGQLSELTAGHLVGHSAGYMHSMLRTIYMSVDESCTSALEEALEQRSREPLDPGYVSAHFSTPATHIEGDERLKERVNALGQADVFYFTLCPELRLPSVSVSLGANVRASLTVPLLPIRPDAGPEVIASVLYTFCVHEERVSALTVACSLLPHLARARFSVVRYLQWHAKQKYYDASIVYPCESFILPASGEGSTGVGEPLGALGLKGNARHLAVAFLFLEYLASHGLVNSDFVAGLDGSHIEAFRLHSPVILDYAIPLCVSVLQDQPEAVIKDPSLLRGRPLVRGYQQAVDPCTAVPLALLAELLKTGLSETALAARPDVHHLFNLAVCRPLTSTDMTATAIFVGNTLLNELICSGYLCVYETLCALFYTETPGSGLVPADLFALQSADLLSSFLDECTGRQLLDAAFALRTSLNVPFVLIYRTFREGPAFSTDFLRALIAELETWDLPKEARLPYELLVAIYEALGSMPWTGRREFRTTSFQKSNWPVLSENRELVDKYRDLLMHFFGPATDVAVHRFSDMLIQDDFLTSPYYARLGDSLLNCALSKDIDPSFLVSLLACSCTPGELKSTKLADQDACFSGREEHATSDSSEMEAPASVPSPDKNLAAVTAMAGALGASTATMERVRPYAYHANYLVLHRTTFSMLRMLGSDENLAHYKTIFAYLSYLIKDLHLLLSPTPHMAGLCLAGGTVDVSIGPLAIGYLYLVTERLERALAARVPQLEAEARTYYAEMVSIQEELLAAELPVTPLTVDIGDPQFLQTVQSVVERQIIHLRTANLSLPGNPFAARFDVKIFSFADQMLEINAYKNSTIAELASATQECTKLQNLIRTQAVANPELAHQHGLATTRYNQAAATLQRLLTFETNLQYACNGSKELYHMICLIQQAKLKTQRLQFLLERLKAGDLERRGLEYDRSVVALFATDDAHLFGSPFTRNLHWLRLHLSSIYSEGSDSIDYEQLSRAAAKRLADARDEGARERAAIHRRRCSIFAALAFKTPSMQGRALIEAENALRSVCTELQIYRGVSGGNLQPRSIFSVLDRELQTFSLCIRHFTPPPSASKAYVRFMNLFSPETAYAKGVELADLAGHMLDPLWVVLQTTVDILATREQTSEMGGVVRFLGGYLSRLSCMYSAPATACARLVSEAMRHATASSDHALLNALRYYSTSSSFAVYRQAFSYGNPAMAFTGPFAELANSLAGVGHGKAQTALRLTDSQVARYVVNTTLVPLLRCLYPRYLLIYVAVLQYLANKGSPHIVRVPVLLMSPGSLPSDTQLRVMDVDTPPFFGEGSLLGVAFRSYSLGSFAGLIFSHSPPSRALFDDELMFSLAFKAVGGLTLLPIATFLVSLARTVESLVAEAGTGAEASARSFGEGLKNSWRLADCVFRHDAQRYATLSRNMLSRLKGLLGTFPAGHDDRDPVLTPLAAISFESVVQGPLSVQFQGLVDQATAELQRVLIDVYGGCLADLHITSSAQLFQLAPAPRHIHLTTLDQLQSITDEVTAACERTVHLLRKPELQGTVTKMFRAAALSYVQRLHRTYHIDRAQNYAFIADALRDVPLGRGANAVSE